MNRGGPSPPRSMPPPPPSATRSTRPAKFLQESQTPPTSRIVTILPSRFECHDVHFASQSFLKCRVDKRRTIVNNSRRLLVAPSVVSGGAPGGGVRSAIGNAAGTV